MVRSLTKAQVAHVLPEFPEIQNFIHLISGNRVWVVLEIEVNPKIWETIMEDSFVGAYPYKFEEEGKRTTFIQLENTSEGALNGFVFREEENVLVIGTGSESFSLLYKEGFISE